jgi:hypothetical protein
MRLQLLSTLKAQAGIEWKGKENERDKYITVSLHKMHVWIILDSLVASLPSFLIFVLDF